MQESHPRQFLESFFPEILNIQNEIEQPYFISYDKGQFLKQNRNIQTTMLAESQSRLLCSEKKIK